ncbi:hypothetical protein BDV26DRAFT_292600 [Aspergillus bertholletiae]|uniref:DUF7703 domain-containing protein n=1 Tax=Aspergillus bertholletiae TaxID=1226010 RepID=A0A5N7B8D3_9EURO|nr:hypothetical protein BDV26DRAFT_292600 [Aspergillus bertholletiae]
MSDSANHPTARLADGFNKQGQSVQIVTLVFTSLSLYNGMELVAIIWSSFEHYRSVYFWALFLSNTLGVIPYSIGAVLDVYGIGPQWLMLTIQLMGFYFMVPGQSVVLYSRLHLVLQNGKLLRAFRFLITMGTLLFLVPISISYYGSVYLQHPWDHAYGIIERLQLIYFCVQEGLLSGAFIVETVRLIRLNPIQDRRRKGVLYELVVVNLVIIFLDVVLLLLEFLGFYFLQVILKGMVYSLKLKLEFAVLGRLTSTICAPRPSLSWSTIQRSTHKAGDIIHDPAY